MKLILPILLLLSLSVCRAQQLLWARYFASIDTFNYQPTYLRTPDGGFLLAGTSSQSLPEQGGQADAFYMRTDQEGNPLWGQVVNAYYVLQPFAVNGNGHGYGILGIVQTMPDSLRHLWFATADANGKLVAQKRAFAAPVFLLAASVTSDNGFIAVMAPYDRTRSLLLARLDSNGDILWSRGYEDITSGTFTPTVHQLDDGGFIIAGADIGLTARDSSDVKLFRIGAAGDSLWVRGYMKAKGSPVAADAIRTPEGGFLLVSSRRRDFSSAAASFVMKTDSLGVPVDTTLGEGWGNVILSAISPTHDGNYMVAGSRTDAIDSLLLMKVDPVGHPLWTAPSTIGDSVRGYRLPRMLRPLDDGGYVVAGEATTTRSDIFLMKFNEAAAGVEVSPGAVPREMDLSRR